MKIKLVTIGENEATKRVRAALERVPNAVVETQYAPPSLAEWFECPFIRDETGLEYFGVDDIEWFVHKSLDADAPDESEVGA